MSSLELILFDLDGTLYKSTEILPRSYREGIEKFLTTQNIDCEVPSRQQILNEIGNPAHEIYENLFPELDSSQREQLSQQIVDELTKLIRQDNGSLIADVPEVLGQLQNHYPLGLVTNARIDYLEAVVETYQLGQYFSRMKCIEMVESNKKARLVRDMLEEFGVSARQTVLIGDRKSDYEAANETGTGFIGCEFGYSTGEEFLDAETIHQFRELLNHPRIEIPVA